MQKMTFQYLLLLLIFIYSPMADSKEGPQYHCGIAIGFPPYQYVDAKGNSAGIDYDVAKLVFETAGLQVKFVQAAWDDLMFGLIHKTGKIDLLCGAEISDQRKEVLDFSIPYYKRHIVLFTLKNSPIKRISDLYGKVITGDRHSFFEKYLGKEKANIRVLETKSKEESFDKLKAGTVVAVIAPHEVGHYMAHKLGIEVKILEEKDPGSPVAFAVSKGNKELLAIIDQSLQRLLREGKIDKIFQKNHTKKL